MKLSDKIRTLRKNAGLTQEQLGDKLNVSRQAITKWERGDGIPDIYNLVALSNLFGLSLDELMAKEKAVAEKRFLYESHTEHDIDAPCCFDLHLHAASSLVVRSGDSEKLKVYAGSSDIPELEKAVKVKVDTDGGRCDVQVRTKLSEARCRQSLVLEIVLPEKYVRHIEVAARVGKAQLKNIRCETIEVDARCGELTLEDIHATVDVTSSSDMSIRFVTLDGNLSVNQHGAVSRVLLPEGAAVRTRCRGIHTRLLTALPDLVSPDAAYEVELNGVNAELTVSRQ